MVKHFHTFGDLQKTPNLRMKKIVFTLLLTAALQFQVHSQSKSTPNVRVNIDLTAITDDKVKVTVTPPKFTTNEAIYNIPKTVPGTYSEDNYGKYIDNLKAFDKSGNAVAVAKTSDNT